MRRGGPREDGEVEHDEDKAETLLGVAVVLDAREEEEREEEREGDDEVRGEGE